MGLSEESKVCTTSLRPGALLITRKGRNARTRRKTLRMSKILEVVPKTTVTKVSTSETVTNVPSMIFQPDLKQAFSPQNKPVEMALKAISIEKTMVKTLFIMSRISRSNDHGGILGRSIAKVMQLQAMNTSMMKSNQACSVRLWHHKRNLIKKASGDNSESDLFNIDTFKKYLDTYTLKYYFKKVSRQQIQIL